MKKHREKTGQRHQAQASYLDEQDDDDLPSSVKVEGTSTETRPVTQVALVAVKRASIQ